MVNRKKTLHEEVVEFKRNGAIAELQRILASTTKK